MSDQPNDKPIFGERPMTKREELFAQGTMLTLRGMGYGAILFIGLVVFVYALYLFSLLLPPESKEAPDPTPNTFLMEPVYEQAGRTA